MKLQRRQVYIVFTACTHCNLAILFCSGINQYAMQMMKMRALTHLKYAHVHMEVVSSICLPEEGIVRVQWRVVGLSQLKALRFWKYTAWSYSKSFREDAE